jgi:hypothetical protein
MSEIDYRGWSGRGRNIHVGPLPGRKAIALYRITGETTIDVLGYFRTENAAGRFLDEMDAMLGVEPEARWRGPASVKGVVA